jgi:hypothetical protein
MGKVLLVEGASVEVYEEFVSLMELFRFYLRVYVCVGVRRDQCASSFWILYVFYPYGNFLLNGLEFVSFLIKKII